MFLQVWRDSIYDDLSDSFKEKNKSLYILGFRKC